KIYPHVGCTLPARWKRSLNDAKVLSDWGVNARIVKGQWADPSARRINYRKNFMDLAGVLAGKKIRTSVATHDDQLAYDTLKILKDSGSHCELELFFSLPLKGMEVALALDVPVRIYTAYGAPAVPYTVSITHTRPAIVWGAVRNFLR